jgi:hypothetical protein
MLYTYYAYFLPCCIIEVEYNFTKDIDIYSTSDKYVFGCPQTYLKKKQRQFLRM